MLKESHLIFEMLGRWDCIPSIIWWRLEGHGMKVWVVPGADHFDALTLWANDTLRKSS
jgi:hypothetical protein